MYEIASIVGDEFTWVMTVSLTPWFIHSFFYYFIYKVGIIKHKTKQEDEKSLVIVIIFHEKKREKWKWEGGFVKPERFRQKRCRVRIGQRHYRNSPLFPVFMYEFLVACLLPRVNFSSIFICFCLFIRHISLIFVTIYMEEYSFLFLFFYFINWQKVYKLFAPKSVIYK